MTQTALSRRMRIFISYAAEQHAVAEQTSLRLASGGHDVFFDRTSLQPGHAFDQAILDEIRSRDLMVFFISPQSVAEGSYTRTELRFARDVWPQPAGNVLPVMAVETPFEQIPPYLKAVTILRSEGDLIAEVVGAVSDLSAGLRLGETVVERLKEIERRSEETLRAHQVAELDREWAETARRSKVSGGREVPRLAALVPLVFCVGIGIFGAGEMYEAFGLGPVVLPILFGVIAAVVTVARIDEYNEGRDSYLARRKHLLHRNRKPDEPSSREGQSRRFTFIRDRTEK